MEHVPCPKIAYMTKPQTLIRSLGVGDATLLVVGCIVGVGIFRTSSSIAALLDSPALILTLWIFGGLLSLCGALCYAELAAMFPNSGGDYVYLSRIYGPFWGFLFGWTKLFVERTGTIAILGVVFAEYLDAVLGYGPAWARWIAGGAILTLTAVNVRGIRWGTALQNSFTLLKVFALGSIIVVGLVAPAHPQAVWTPLPPSAFTSASTWQALGLSLLFVLWTYGGWTEAAYVAEEVKQPTRTVPLAIVGGVLLTTVLYVLVNAMYLRHIPIEKMPQTGMVASAMMRQALGESGARFIGWMVACSAFGALNGYILTGGRILYAIGRDHALFAKLGMVHRRFHTPARALWANAAIAIALVFTKTFEQIMTYSTVVISVFFTMAVFGVMILRRTQPDQPRPYRAWGYPATPLIFGLTMIGFITDVCVKQPVEAMFGFGFLAIGVPLYWLSQSTHRPAP